jgi:hypothetical protein
VADEHAEREAGFFLRDVGAGGGEGWERIRAPATECGRIRPGFLEEERRVLGERWFRQEYLCEFTESAGAVFDRDVVERAITTAVPPLKLFPWM